MKMLGIADVPVALEKDVASHGVKRYNLVLPMLLFTQLDNLAKEQGESIVGVLKKFIKLGLLVVELQKDPSAEVVIRRGDEEETMPPLWWP